MAALPVQAHANYGTWSIDFALCILLKIFKNLWHILTYFKISKFRSTRVLFEWLVKAHLRLLYKIIEKVSIQTFSFLNFNKIFYLNLSINICIIWTLCKKNSFNRIKAEWKKLWNALKKLKPWENIMYNIMGLEIYNFLKRIRNR